MSQESWQELVDLDRLRAWMDTQELGHGPIEHPVPLAGARRTCCCGFRAMARRMCCGVHRAARAATAI